MKRVAMILLFAACALNWSFASGTGEPGATGEPKVVTWWKFTEGNQLEPYHERRIAEYEKLHPGTKIKLEMVPWENYLDKLLVAASSKTGPDIYYRSNDYFQTFIEKGFAMDLYPKWVDDSMLAKLEPSVRASITRGKKVFGFPSEMEPIVVFYRKDLMDKAGLAYPKVDWTWQDLRDYARKLTITEGGDIKQYGIGLPTDPGSYTTFIFYPTLWSAGGDLVNNEFKKSLLDQSAAASALQFWSDLINKDKVAPPKMMGNMGSAQALANGQIAMFPCGPWALNEIANNYSDMSFGIVPVPRGPGKQQTVYGGWFSIVNPYGKYAKEGADFFKWYFGDPKRSTDRASFEGVLTPWVNELKTQSFVSEYSDLVKRSPLTLEKMIEIRDGLTSKAGMLRAEPAYAVEMVEALSDAIQDSLFAGVAAQDAMNKAAKRIDDYLSKTTIKYPPGNF